MTCTCGAPAEHELPDAVLCCACYARDEQPCDHLTEAARGDAGRLEDLLRERAVWTLDWTRATNWLLRTAAP